MVHGAVVWIDLSETTYHCRYFAMERQGSAGSTTAMINGANVSPSAGTWSAPVAGLDSTIIPIREEFRCRRLWFFYHDIRAFTTSVSEAHCTHLLPWSLCMQTGTFGTGSQVEGQNLEFNMQLHGSAGFQFSVCCVACSVCCIASLLKFSFVIRDQITRLSMCSSNYSFMLCLDYQQSSG